ncbi:MAG: hypothetical protein JXQ27_04465, partial [Acidobacteria bacterium]|nr:hypothetical protein [Acidobacteriota bacterium]
GRRGRRPIRSSGKQRAFQHTDEYRAEIAGILKNEGLTEVQAEDFLFSFLSERLFSIVFHESATASEAVRRGNLSPPDASRLAANVVDYRVARGVTFRKAHGAIGKLTDRSERTGRSLLLIV